MSAKYLPYDIEEEAAYQEYVKANPYSKNMPNELMTIWLLNHTKKASLVCKRGRYKPIWLITYP